MPCGCCDAARDWPGTTAASQYVENCPWCGARYIQRIPKFGMIDGRPVTQAEAIAWRRRVLAVWVKWGHPEEELRRLAKGDELPLAPKESCARPSKRGG